MMSTLQAKTDVQKPLSLLRAAALGLSMMAATAAWAAPAVIFVATDLADTTVGQDLWRYDYTLSGPVDAFGSVNLLFGHASYADLLSQTTDATLSLLDTQPDAGLLADGVVFVTPTNGLLAGDTTALSVQFVWLGQGAPGSQPFEVVDGNGSPAGSGRSAAPAVNGVPEPSALALALTALLALRALRRGGARA